MRKDPAHPFSTRESGSLSEHNILKFVTTRAGASCPLATHIGHLALSGCRDIQARLPDQYVSIRSGRFPESRPNSPPLMRAVAARRPQFASPYRPTIFPGSYGVSWQSSGFLTWNYRNRLVHKGARKPLASPTMADMVEYDSLRNAAKHLPKRQGEDSTLSDKASVLHQSARPTPFRCSSGILRARFAAC